MNSKLLQKSMIFILTLLMVVLISHLFYCQKSEKNIIANWQENQKIMGNLTITYPANNTVFPPEIVAPTFIWKDEIEQVERWLVSVSLKEKDQAIYVFTNQPQWRPDPIQWDKIKILSMKQNTQVAILGVKGSSIVSGAEVFISTSKDSVNASIFYRDVPLPFEFANKNLKNIRWRLGDISAEQGSKIMITDLPVCGNCHSFTADGETMAMDVDYANDKGSYVISKIEKETVLSLDKIVSWSEYRRDDGETTFGLLSQISPDGRYVASTVKDRSIFVPKDDLMISQLFFPIKGIIVIYDRETKKFWSLPGADDPEYCQSNPSWAPDGKHLIFARAKAYHSKEAEKYKGVVLPTSVAAEFIEGKRDFKFDLYKIPFNNGKGGTPKPIPGASNNGLSNFFPRISPNGKWIVFTQAKNFMLLQPDSKLFIMPIQGGTPREMNCNNSMMNSWHSWSPNSQWLVFSSKERGAYTQIYLTHIDANGNDTPPVLVENFILPNRAINIPEFVNITSKAWDNIVDAFSDSSNYALRIGHNELYYGELNKAIKAYSKAIKQNPNDFDAYYSRGIAYMRMRNLKGALEDFNKAITLKPDYANAYVSQGDIKFKMRDYKGAVKSYDTSIAMNKDNAHAYSARGVCKAMLKQYLQSIKDFDLAIKINPDSAEYWTNRAISKKYLGKLDAAIVDLNKAVQMNPNYLLAQQNLGDINVQLKKFPDAIMAYSQAIQIKPGDFHLYHKRGDVQLRSGNYQQAINDYNQSLSLKPNDIDVYLARGVCKTRLKDFAEAVKDFDKCIQLNPKDVEAYYNRADAKHQMKKMMEALEDFNMALKLNPKFVAAYYERGIVKIELGQKDDGCKDLHRALKLGYMAAESVINEYCK